MLSLLSLSPITPSSESGNSRPVRLVNGVIRAPTEPINTPFCNSLSIYRDWRETGRAAPLFTIIPIIVNRLLSPCSIAPRARNYTVIILFRPFVPSVKDTTWGEKKVRLWEERGGESERIWGKLGIKQVMTRREN